MRILFLSAWLPYPPDNGSKIRVFHLLRALANRHEVTLLSFAFDATGSGSGSTGPLPELCKSVSTVPASPFEWNSAGALRRFLSPQPLFTRPIPQMQELVEDALSQETFDAVIASTEAMAAYALRAPRGTARVLEEHNSLARMMAERYKAATTPLGRLRCWASWRKARRFEARLFSRFDLVTMTSPQDLETSLRDLPGYRGRVEMVPNGVDCHHNRLGLARPAPKTLVYNGALTYSANYDAMRFFLAEIYPLIQRQEPGVSLTITGSTSGVDRAKLRLDASVGLTGYVDDVRLPVAGAWACVVPIRQGGGTRLKILEAMALGTPVVATPKGAEGLDVTPGTNILTAGKPGDFAEQVLRLLRDADLRAALSGRARTLVEQRYDWRAIGRRFARHVEELVEGTAPLCN